MEVALDQSWADCVDSDLVRRQFLRQPDRHRVDGALRRRVVDPLVGSAEHGGLRRDVDDRSGTTSGPHAIGRLACAQERAREVDRPQSLECFDRVGVERAVAAGDARIVDQHVEPATPLVDLGEHRQYGRLVADVALHCERVVADLVHQRLGSVGAGRVVHHDAVAGFGRHPGDPAPIPRPAPVTSITGQILTLAHCNRASRPAFTSGQSLRTTEYIAESRATVFSSPGA